jgi:hypothetical protein
MRKISKTLVALLVFAVFFGSIPLVMASEAKG